MATIFDLTPDIVNFARQGFDDLITHLGKNIKLVYAPIFTACSCSPDGIGNKPQHHWTHGGPSPVGGICQYCDGSGKKVTVSSEIIRATCDWNAKPFNFDTSTNIRQRKGNQIVKTRGYMTDLPKILKCEYAVFQVPLLDLQECRFRLMSNPVDFNNIVQTRYVTCYWEMIDG